MIFVRICPLSATLDDLNIENVIDTMKIVLLILNNLFER